MAWRRRAPQPVCVVTTSSACGQPVGLAASSVAAVSVSPAAVLSLNVRRGSAAGAALAAGRAFAVHLMGSGEEAVAVARAFGRAAGEGPAGAHAERFQGVAWRWCRQTGAPLLDVGRGGAGARAVMLCEPMALSGRAAHAGEAGGASTAARAQGQGADGAEAERFGLRVGDDALVVLGRVLEVTEAADVRGGRGKGAADTHEEAEGACEAVLPPPLLYLDRRYATVAPLHEPGKPS